MLANKFTQRCSRLLAATALVMSLGLLAACESLPKNISDLPFIGKVGGAVQNPASPLAPPVARAWPDPVQDVLNQRARGFGLVNAPEMQRYLAGLYARIKTQAGVPGWPGGVHILANNALDAYATGAGNIYISLPWLTSVESEDELVALLSHEFGHIYLHYHELEGAVADADTTTGFLGLGIAVVKKTGQATGWTQVDSLFAAYTLGRGLVTTLYSRSQESAADNFSLHICLKLGYSYEHGIKAFLERMASWEETNEKRQKSNQDLMLKAIRQQSMDSAMKAASPQPSNQSFARSTGELGGNINSALQQLGFEINKLSSKVRSDHPETAERIDAMAVAIEPFPDIQASKPAITRPLKSALQDRRTAAIVKNYAFAFKALAAPKDPDALDWAKSATAAPTAAHAVPLFALYTVMNEQPAAAARQRIEPGQVLEANFNSEPDRAWKTYQERSTRLKEGRQTVAAKKVMDAGLAYFRNAEEAWPDAIRFYGETQGWDEAKRMAQDCGKNFRRVAVRCTHAASSPAEQAEAARKSKAKADQIIEKLTKKK